MNKLTTFWLLALTAGFPHLVLAEKFDPGRLSATTIYDKLDQPMELEVADDGRIFFIELNGEFRVFLPETQEAVLIHKFDVARRGEVGLIGLALDPQFSQNGWVYLQYSPIGLTSQRTSRFTLKGNELVKNSCLLYTSDAADE